MKASVCNGDHDGAVSATYVNYIMESNFPHQERKRFLLSAMYHFLTSGDQLTPKDIYSRVCTIYCLWSFWQKTYLARSIADSGFLCVPSSPAVGTKAMQAAKVKEVLLDDFGDPEGMCPC